MSDSYFNDATTTQLIFDDPVAYLGRLGIEAELVMDESMPAAA